MGSRRKAEGAYTRDPNALIKHGLSSSGVLIFVLYTDKDRYCIEATSPPNSNLVLRASDTTSGPREGHCPKG